MRFAPVLDEPETGAEPRLLGRDASRDVELPPPPLTVGFPSSPSAARPSSPVFPVAYSYLNEEWEGGGGGGGRRTVSGRVQWEDERHSWF